MTTGELAMRTSTRHRITTALLAAGLAGTTLAGCGHRLSTEALVRANSRTLHGPVAPGAASGAPGATVPAPAAVPGAGAGAGNGHPSGSVPDASSGGDAAGAPSPSGTPTTRPSGAASGNAPARPSTPATARPGAPGPPRPATTGATQPPVGTPGETGRIVIGSVGNYSGIAAPPQQPMARAAQVWVEYVNNRGGLFGRPVQLIVVDDRGDPAQHVAALRELVENRKVVAFVANAAALTVASGRQYLESVKVPVFGTACANTTEFTSPIFFPQCEPVTDVYYSVVQAGVELGGTSPEFAMIACSEAQTCTDGYDAVVTKGAATKAGGKVVYTARASLAQPDFTSECRGARSAGAKIVYVLLDPTGVIRFGQSCARQGYRPVYAQTSATVFYETKDQPGFENLMVVTQLFSFVSRDTPARKEFGDVMASLYGKEPGPGEAYGWASAKLFAEVATRAAAQFRSISPKTLVDAAHTFQGETLGGLTVPLTFPAGGPAQIPPCGFVTRVQGGQWVALNNGQPLCR